MNSNREQSSNIEDKRGDNTFYDYLTPYVSLDNKDAQMTLNGMLSEQREMEQNWVSSQSGTKDQNQFLLDTFKRARSTGFPIHPLEPILHGLPSTAFEGQAGL